MGACKIQKCRKKFCLRRSPAFGGVWRRSSESEILAKIGSSVVVKPHHNKTARPAIAGRVTLCLRRKINGRHFVPPIKWL